MSNEVVSRLSRRLRRLGYDAQPSKETSEYLAGLGFDVATVFDVGVAGGTANLYGAFPDAKFVLLEPIAEFEAKVRRNYGDQIDIDFHACGVGAEAGELELTIPYVGDKAMGTRATLTSFDDDSGAYFSKVDTRTVPVRTLDEIAAGYAGPFGLKVDTEGFEIEVIRGAGEFLKSCAFVIAEVSVRRRFADGYRFSDFTALMAENGFEIHDFIRPPNPAATDCDAIFAPWDSPLFDFSDRRLKRMSGK